MKKGAMVVLLGVLVVGGHFLGRALRRQGVAEKWASAGARDKSAAAERREVPLGGDAKGPEDAVINIVEFSDFQCPFCNSAQATLRKLQQEYGNQIRIFFRHSPLPSHRQALLASQAALAAGAQGKFWEMHDKLFANQKALARADIEKYAQQVGLDLTRFKAALDGNVYRARVDEDIALARQLGVKGLPASFINGRLIVGAKAYDRFKEVVEDELARARKLTAAGTPRTQIHQGE